MCLIALAFSFAPSLPHSVLLKEALNQEHLFTATAAFCHVLRRSNIDIFVNCVQTGCIWDTLYT